MRGRCKNPVATTARRANTCCSSRGQFCWKCLSTCAKCAKTDCVGCMANHDVECVTTLVPLWVPRVGAPQEVMKAAAEIAIKPRTGTSGAAIDVDDEFVETAKEFQTSLRTIFMCASVTTMKTLKELAVPKGSFVREQIRKVIDSMELEAHHAPTSGGDDETLEQRVRSDVGDARPEPTGAVPDPREEEEAAAAAMLPQEALKSALVQ